MRNYECSITVDSLTLIYPKRFDHCVNRFGIEAGLELGEQLTGDGRNIHGTAHGQGDALATGVEGNLQAFR